MPTKFDNDYYNDDDEEEDEPDPNEDGDEDDDSKLKTAIEKKEGVSKIVAERILRERGICSKHFCKLAKNSECLLCVEEEIASCIRVLGGNPDKLKAQENKSVASIVEQPDKSMKKRGRKIREG